MAARLLRGCRSGEERYLCGLGSELPFLQVWKAGSRIASVLQAASYRKSRGAAFDAPLSRGASGWSYSLGHPYISASHAVLLAPGPQAALLTLTLKLLLTWSDPMAPIHDAARRGDAETLRRLLAEGVSPNAVDIDDDLDDDIEEPLRQTPLHVLLVSGSNMSGRVACFKLLRDAGANLDATDSVARRHTALHYAAVNGDATIVSLLVEAGANVNAADSEGCTALHFGKKYADCVEVLLAGGASVNARNVDGSTSFDVALSHHCRRIWPLFLRAGAEIPIDETHPYIVRVRNAGGWKKYEQQHLARITSILAPTPLLPPELVRHVVSFWLHAGYY